MSALAHRNPHHALVSSLAGLPDNRLAGTNVALDVTPTSECAGTGTKILYGAGGALLGFAAGWMLNDENKGKIKARARSGAASAAERAAARLRR